MATVYRKSKTIPLPEDAKIVTRRGELWAKWSSKGKSRSGRLNKSGAGVVVHSPTWTAIYRTADGRKVRKSTGCRDETAARAVLTNWLTREENIRSGMISAERLKTADHLKAPISKHVADYLTHLDAGTKRGSKPNPRHRANVVRQLDCVIDECEFATLADLDPTKLEHWLNDRFQAGMSARTRNMYRGTWLSIL